MGNEFFCKKNLLLLLEELKTTHFCTSMVEEAILPFFLLAHAGSENKRGVFLLLPDSALAEKTAKSTEKWGDLLGLFPSIRILPDGIAGGKSLTDAEIPRASIFHELLEKPPAILLASASGALSPAPKPASMREETFLLRPGTTFPMEKLLEKLVALDYDDEPEVTLRGEFARRGGILDVFSPAEEYPCRIEFWGDEIDSIRFFSPENQLSIKKADSCRIVPRSGSHTVKEGEEAGDLTDYLALWDPVILYAYPGRTEKMLESFFAGPLLKKWEFYREKGIFKDPLLLLDAVESSDYPDALPSPLFPASKHILEHFPAETGENALELIRLLSTELIRQLHKEKCKLFFAGESRRDVESLKEYIKDTLSFLPEKTPCFQANIPCGLYAPGHHFALFSEHELFASPSRLTRSKVLPDREEKQKKFRALTEDDPLEAFQGDLEEGDLAVHINYGICRYRGLKLVEGSAGAFEALELEFEDDKIMHVPISQAHCISRYIGGSTSSGKAKLSRLGTSRWSKLKLDAASAVRTLAMDMLKLHAARTSHAGSSFPKDDLQQQLFEKAFPFTETPDQLKAAEEIKRDMESPRPMDRLLCGDVGYGKTEVAMRAVFKCVMAGKQAAILVPTTVLAQQHFVNFQERFASYPVIVEALSRFRTAAEQKEILKRAASGRADIIIGTHRLLQEDVVFKDLGLVVVDEEQRFGVLHKEKLKKLRSCVDVLTMTATPIPRTLYFSMSGMRDLSTILSAPVRRLPVQTIVSPDEDAVIAGAIARELQRKGQVYFLHNRVGSIEKAASRIRALVPEARIGIGHGQMKEHELEEVMGKFLDGKIDVFVCTTIIESGIDVPNANTILIDHADRLGLAELYQLRGRVGRWNRQAYAYLLLPKSALLSGSARERLAAIRKYTHLGSGFKLALRDLEIRGAGNILGAEQSGHINAIGFDLYCQLLRTISRQMKGERVEAHHECDLVIDFVEYCVKPTHKERVAAAFPEEYIPAGRLRLHAYKELAQLSSREALERCRKNLEDRFGKLPKEAENLFTCHAIRTFGVEKKFDSISCVQGKLVVQKGSQILKARGKFPVIPDTLEPETRLAFLRLILERDYDIPGPGEE